MVRGHRQRTAAGGSTRLEHSPPPVLALVRSAAYPTDQFWPLVRSKGAGMTSAPFKRLVHLELHTDDLEGARALYQELCGWRPRRIDAGCGSYLALELGGGLGGGMVGCGAERPVWLPYVEVDEIATATDEARALGAGVLLEPREGPTGWRSVLSTPAGGEVAFWQPKR